jgi:hypothetical protein
MKKIYSFLFLFISIQFYGQWVDLNTGINDDLSGVVFLQNNGIVAGENGLYFTTNGGVGLTSWTRFEITDNPAISDVYENTKFTHCYSKTDNSTSSGDVYACGVDMSSNLAVIFKVSLPSLNYELKYYGGLTGKLNKIDYHKSKGMFMAVGDNGIIIEFNESIVRIISSNITEDLNSVASNLGSDYIIASDNKLWRVTTFIDNLNNLLQINTSTVNKDVWKVNDEFYSVGANDYTHTSYTSSSSNMSTCLNFMPLVNLNSIFVSGSTRFVGTDNGIYKSGGSTVFFSNSYLELQPSSENFIINEFWKQSSSSIIYACGNNGIVLKTSNNGGITKPFAKILTDGNCINNPTQFSSITGSVVSVQWYANGQLLYSGSPTTFNHTFNTIGSYLITLTVQNSAGEQTTVSKTIYIQPIPEIDKNLALSDNILCKEEAIQIEIENTEINVKYVLKKEGVANSNFGESISGNGGTLTFSTSLINETGFYYIDAVNTLANCSRRFTDNFLITVEKTKADFHYDLINAYYNEQINFYNKSIEAHNFLWEIELNGLSQSYNIPNFNANFNTSGQTDVDLTVWSNNNCYDNINTLGPNIVSTPTNQNDCFLLIKDGEDLPWPGYYNFDIRQTKQSIDGFLTCGAYNNEVFNSTYGVSKSLMNKKGGYLSKYDKDGLLKWMVYTVNETPLATNDNSILSCVEDQNGDIYISGISSGIFFDNAGNEINLSQNGQVSMTAFNKYIIKLNSRGEFIWIMQNARVNFIKLYVDNDNNLVAISNVANNSPTNSIELYFNGIQTQTIGLTTSNPTNNIIIKISPLGNVIWDSEINIDCINIPATDQIVEVVFDSLNNYFLGINYEGQISFYSANNNSPTVFPGNPAPAVKSAVVKYNSNGEFLWFLPIKTLDNANQVVSSTRLRDLKIDQNNNIYVTGLNGRNSTFVAGNYRQVFFNLNNTQTEISKGPFFIAKINSNGVCEWIRSALSYDGTGHKIIVDNNQIKVLGEVSGLNISSNFTTEFDSTNSNNYNLTINPSDYFINTYDLQGNISKVVTNGNNQDSFSVNYFPAFFKGDDNYFYLSKNLQYFNGISGYQDFGVTIPQLNERGGVITRFTEDCGIIKYDAFLANENFDLNKITIYPNPSNGKFKIDLQNVYNNCKIEIYDVLGHLIFENKYTSSNIIDLNLDLQSGIYLIKLKSDQMQYNAKIIID